MIEYLEENIQAITDRVNKAEDTDKEGEIIRIHNYKRKYGSFHMCKIGAIAIAKAIVRDYMAKNDGELPSKADIEGLNVFRRTWCVTQKTFDADVSWEWGSNNAK